MIERELRRDRTLPTFITLLVLAFLLMTFDVRSAGGGMGLSLRVTAQELTAPLQKLAAAVIDPAVDLIEGVAGVAALRAENETLRNEVARLQGQLAGSADDLERLRVLEDLYDLRLAGLEGARTEANVIGRPDPFDPSLIIDKGSQDGIVAGQPVVDSQGYLAGQVVTVSSGYATVVPVTQSREAVTVLARGQVGTLQSVIGSDEMNLEIFDAHEPLLPGDLVLTSSVSVSFPAGIPVGEVIAPAEMEGTALTARVKAFSDPERLRVVVVLAWPTDPSLVGEEEPATATTLPAATPDSSTTLTTAP
ncbi:MAG TPA: rod shape-determining protein MreC [Acidimicrobiia bacterium]|jgi:rod shape-determining protein MreC